MNAKAQYNLSPADLQVLLALARGGTLAQAGKRVGADASTVFRSLQRIEHGLGRRLFERSRNGYLASDLVTEMIGFAEQMEAQLEGARAVAHSSLGGVSGSVRIATTDTVLHGLLAPALHDLRRQHPLLSFDLHTGNELTSLTRRDADIAVRATRRPPQHLVGRHLGPLRAALYAASASPIDSLGAAIAAHSAWIAPDDALPDHPSVLWRKKNLPGTQPVFRVNSILTAAEFVGLDLGVSILPLFLARRRPDLRQISDVLDECQTELWLLTHPETRLLRRVSTVYQHLAQNMQLD